MARINQLIETLCFEVIKLYKYYTVRVFIRKTVLVQNGDLVRTYRSIIDDNNFGTKGDFIEPSATLPSVISRFDPGLRGLRLSEYSINSCPFLCKSIICLI